MRVQQSALERQLDARIIVVIHFKTRFIGGAVDGARGAKLLEESQCCNDERKGMHAVGGSDGASLAAVDHRACRGTPIGFAVREGA